MNCRLRNSECQTPSAYTAPRAVGARGQHRIAVEEDRVGHSAMVVEEDSMGFSTVEVGDKHTGPQGLGMWS